MRGGSGEDKAEDEAEEEEAEGVGAALAGFRRRDGNGGGGARLAAAVDAVLDAASAAAVEAAAGLVGPDAGGIFVHVTVLVTVARSEQTGAVSPKVAVRATAQTRAAMAARLVAAGRPCRAAVIGRPRTNAHVKDSAWILARRPLEAAAAAAGADDAVLSDTSGRLHEGLTSSLACGVLQGGSGDLRLVVAPDDAAVLPGTVMVGVLRACQAAGVTVERALPDVRDAREGR
ncbi:hypothetical protein HK405_009682, partial [Cladochytrium tenue]